METKTSQHAKAPQEHEQEPDAMRDGHRLAPGMMASAAKNVV
jgi:hypothetical protein